MEGVEGVAGTGRTGVVGKDRKKDCRLYTSKTLVPNRTQAVCTHLENLWPASSTVKKQ